MSERKRWEEIRDEIAGALLSSLPELRNERVPVLWLETANEACKRLAEQERQIAELQSRLHCEDCGECLDEGPGPECFHPAFDMREKIATARAEGAREERERIVAIIAKLIAHCDDAAERSCQVEPAYAAQWERASLMLESADVEIHRRAEEPRG